MSHTSQNPASQLNVTPTSHTSRWLRSRIFCRQTVCILSVAALAIAYATLSVRSQTTIQAAQSGMEILPREAYAPRGPTYPRRASDFLVEPRYSSEPARRSSSERVSNFGQRRAVLQQPVLWQKSPANQAASGLPEATGHGTIWPVGNVHRLPEEQVHDEETLRIPSDVPTHDHVNPSTYQQDGFDARNDRAQLNPPHDIPIAQYPTESYSGPLSFETPSSVNPSAQPNAERSTLEAPVPRSSIGQLPARVMAPSTRPSGNYAPGASGFRATVESDAPPWMEPYYCRTGRLPTGTEESPTPAPSIVFPHDFVAWWDPLVRQSAGLAPQTIPVEVGTLVQQALAHAPQVQVLQADPEVLYAIVRQEEAVFDWRTFLNSKYSDLSDPVGNRLTTSNNAKRFNDNLVNGVGGFKRRTESGGELQIAQTLGHEYSNSFNLIPNPQSTSRLELSFRQPILSRAGTVYNKNQIVTAGIKSNISSDETLQELQSHLFNVAEAYWNLYRARAEFFQRQKLLASAQQVSQTLEARNQVDTIPRQILRARAAVARAESRMQRAVTDIRNGESRLRLLVNDPSMLNSGPLEFTPSESPAAMPSETGLRESLETALVNRPDISRAIRQMRASSVQIGVSKSEMLPRLDFIVTSYVAGLQNDTRIFQSMNDQFTTGRPGYTAGFEFEVPIGNRAAKAKMEQRQWELKRAINAFRVTVETSLTEVEIATREVDTSYREMLGKYQSMVAAQNEVAYLQDRFNVLPMIEDSTMLLLEDLLGGYERLADEESAFVQAQIGYALSIIHLRRSTGMLMRSRHDAPEIQPGETDWMTARFEQTAEETEQRASGSISVRSTPTINDDGKPPAEWSQPIAALSARLGPAEIPAPSSSVENRTNQPVSYGGHSFRSK